MKRHINNLPVELADYLHKYRERILRQGEHGAIPWYITLIQVKEMYLNENVSCLEPYIQLFDTVIVDKSKIMHQLNLIKRQNLTYELKREYIKLQKTRSTSDFANDANNATLIAKRLLNNAFEEKSFSYYWLAMLFRSDFGYIFPEKKCPSLKTPIVTTDDIKEDTSVIYDDIENLRTIMMVEPSDEIIWLGRGEDSIFNLSLYKNSFSFSEENWCWEHLNNLKKSNSFFFKFDTTAKDKNGIYQKSLEEFEYDYCAVKEMIDDVKLDFLEEACRLLIVKDMELSFFPHHLFLDSQGKQFIGEIKPTANIISTEVLIDTNFDEQIEKKYSCSFWCPLDCEQGHDDLALQQLFCNIESYMTTKGFFIQKTLYPQIILSSEINIVCAHGANDISDEQCFYVNDTPIKDLDKIIGEGKLLILFICYSGSMQVSAYQNSVHSLIKKYIRKGYASIIAPMWSLPIDILPIWIAKFFEVFDNCGFVIDAVYEANMSVKQKYADPAAWACLHLFGNPYMKIMGK
jgi:hypothetical protein